MLVERFDGVTMNTRRMIFVKTLMVTGAQFESSR